MHTLTPTTPSLPQCIETGNGLLHWWCVGASRLHLHAAIPSNTRLNRACYDWKLLFKVKYGWECLCWKPWLPMSEFFAHGTFIVACITRARPFHQYCTSYMLPCPQIWRLVALLKGLRTISMRAHTCRKDHILRKSGSWRRSGWSASFTEGLCAWAGSTLPWRGTWMTTLVCKQMIGGQERCLKEIMEMY